MDLEEIMDIMIAFGASDLAELHLIRGEWSRHLVRAASGDAAAATPRPAVSPAGWGEPLVETAMDASVVSPLAGLAYLSPSPEAPDFVGVGSQVEAGDVVAVVEAMKVFNENRTERAGTVEAISIASGAEVEAGQVLMQIV